MASTPLSQRIMKILDVRRAKSKRTIKQAANCLSRPDREAVYVPGVIAKRVTAGAVTPTNLYVPVISPTSDGSEKDSNFSIT